MDFVKVMGIAKRYAEAHRAGEKWPELYKKVFLFPLEGVSSSDIKTAQRELLTWAAEHPERPNCGNCKFGGTDIAPCEDCIEPNDGSSPPSNWSAKMCLEQTESVNLEAGNTISSGVMPKEEKTVENKRTKLEELLDVQHGEKFELDDRDGWFTLYGGNTLCAVNGMVICGSELLGSIICGGVKIIRRPALTDEQREVLEWLDEGGFEVVAYDQKNGNVAAWQKGAEPHISNGEWASNNNKGAMWGEKLDCLRPLLPDWTVLLDVKGAMK